MRIGFVAGELLGAHKNGGIGTATAHAALFAARSGHAVSVLYTGAGAIDYRHSWTERLIAAGVTLTHLDWRSTEIYPDWLRESTVVFDYLRTAAFDLLLFQDWEGGAYASAVARRAALAFPNTRIAVWAHGPTAWLIEANRAPARHQHTLGQLQMERTGFALADAVLCPSRHMLDWLRASGQALPADARCVPLYLWSDPESDAAQARAEPLARVRTLAFFGRLEERKGIDLFLDAILSDALAFEDFRVVFLGKPATRTPEEIRARVEACRPWLVPRLAFETDLDSDGAQTYLAAHDCLAIIPSLIDNAPCVISECLRRRIPFLSTATGGIPELVAPGDRTRVLVPPDAKALAARIAAALGRPFAPAEPAYHDADVAALWRDWFSDQEAALPRAVPEVAAPALGRGAADIAVVLTHYERPALLGQALEALAAQTDTAFELVLVDDGSRDEEAVLALARAERRAWPFRLKVVRQENAYLGAARNAGIRATAAERLIFMDDDNIAFPTLVETLDRAQRATGADIVTCQMTIFRERHDRPALDLLDGGERWAFTAGPPELGLSLNCYGDATGIYRRTVFERVGFFHEWRGVGHEDWHLHVRAALAGLESLSLPVPLYWYRRVPGTMLNTTDRYRNNAIIWDAYRAALPPGLGRLIDLSIRNDLVD